MSPYRFFFLVALAASLASGCGDVPRMEEDEFGAPGAVSRPGIAGDAALGGGVAMDAPARDVSPTGTGGMVGTTGPDASTGGGDSGVDSAAMDAAKSDIPVTATMDSRPPDAIDPLACQNCEAQKCAPSVARCFMATGNATAGRAAGTPKKDLCAAIINCVRMTRCDLARVEDCWCGVGVDALTCLMKDKANGPCKTAIENGAETTLPELVGAHLFDDAYATGNAFILLSKCDRPPRFCGPACLGIPEPDGGVGGVGGFGGVGGTAGVGGMSGQGGAGGDPMAPEVGTDGPDDVGPDAPPPDGPDGGADGPNYPSAAQCLACQQQTGHCASALRACERATGNATGGPAAGTARKDLCLNLLGCIRRTACATYTPGSTTAPDTMDCYCGAGVSPTDCLTAPRGVCKTEFEAAAESVDPMVVGNNFVDPVFSIAPVIKLLQCDYKYCDNDCHGVDIGMPGTGMTPDAGTPDAPDDVPPDGPIDVAPDVSDDTPLDVPADMPSDPALGPDVGDASPACGMCEQTSCATRLSACENAQGNAAAGPAAGQSKAQLCTNLLGCIHGTGCDSVQIEDCWCGVGVDPSTCLSGPAAGHGVCKAAFEAASETTDPNTIAQRFLDTSYASGAAIDLIKKCDKKPAFCLSACSGGGSSGPDAQVDTVDAQVDATDAQVDATDAQPDLPVDSPDAPLNVADAGVAIDGPAPDRGAGGPTADCPDLDGNGIGDCYESLLSNSGFSVVDDVSFWNAGALPNQAWDSANAGGGAASGSIAITNPYVINISGSLEIGSYQCVPISGGATYRLFAQMFIPPVSASQGSGFGGMDLRYFASGDCSGSMMSLAFGPLVSTANAWTTITMGSAAPAGARSVLVRLVAAKAFSDPEFKVLFDNILLKAQ